MNELIVLQANGPLRPTTNPYIVMLHDGLVAAPEVTVREFAWRRAILGRYDVYHVHWPENLVGGHRTVGRLARQALTLLFLLRLRLTRRAVVRTLHNVERPEGMSFVQRWILDRVDRATTLWITINPTTVAPVGAAQAFVPHGDYRSWYQRFDRPAAVPGHVSYFGAVRRYKSVDRLLRAFKATAPARYALTVAGKPSSPELQRELVDLADGDPRVDLTLRFVPDDELVRIVSSSALVCLPYRHMHNSGSVLAALSLGRAVLVPDNPVNVALADEVGTAWVRTFAGELTAEDLAHALESTAALRSDDVPDLSARDWGTGIAQHVEAYHRAVAVRRGTST